MFGFGTKPVDIDELKTHRDPRARKCAARRDQTWYKPAMQDARWLFFDLGNTLISEEAATECRIQRLVDALARCGRRYSIDEVRSAFEEASAKFAPRPVISVIEKLVDDPA